MIDAKTREEFLVMLGGRGASGQSTEKASCLVDFISARNPDDQVELMSVLLEMAKTPGISTGVVLSGRKIHDSRFNELRSMLQDVVQGNMKLLIHTRRPLPEAGKMISDVVFSVPNEEERDFALAAVITDDAVPYRAIPVSSLQEFPKERLQNIIRKHEDEVCQLRCIHRAQFGSTVEAELMLKVIASVQDYEERVGLMEYLLTMFRQEVVEAAKVFS